MATEVARLPQLEVFNRVLGLPMVELALAKSAQTYYRVKDCHHLIHWALSTAEASLSTATRQAVPIAAPIAKKLENPIQFVDHTLCRGLDKIEEKMPLVKEKPELILENAYILALETVRPAMSTISVVNDMIIAQASALMDISWTKANQVLGTHYGLVAVKSLDNTVNIVDKLIDKYFPATGEEEAIVVHSPEEDKLLHTLQTVGRLSNKAARRVYSNVSSHLRTINKDNLRAYVGSLVQFLYFTRYIQTTNNKIQTQPAPSKNNKTSNNKKNKKTD